MTPCCGMVSENFSTPPIRSPWQWSVGYSCLANWNAPRWTFRNQLVVVTLCARDVVSFLVSKKKKKKKRRRYNVKCNPFVRLTYHYFFNITPEYVDAFVQSWHKFKSSFALEIGPFAFAAVCEDLFPVRRCWIGDLRSVASVVSTMMWLVRSTQRNDCSVCCVCGVALWCRRITHRERSLVWADRATLGSR